MQRFCILAVVVILPACSDSRSDEDKVLDAVVNATNQVFTAIEEDATWRISASEGSEINGTLDNTIGGSVSAVGWRSGAEHTADQGFHRAFSEKLFLSYANWTGDGIVINGSLTVTRHSHDFGPSGGSIDDASRTTSYRGSVTTSGEVGGAFQLDVHASASGKILWTCGLVNEVEMGHGACY